MSLGLKSGYILKMMSGSVVLSQTTNSGELTQSDVTEEVSPIEEITSQDGEKNNEVTSEAAPIIIDEELAEETQSHDVSEEIQNGDVTEEPIVNELEGQVEELDAVPEDEMPIPESDGMLEEGEAVNPEMEGATMVDDGMAMDDMNMGMEPGMESGSTAKEPLLSNWFFIGGISAASLVVGVVLGILLAKKKIKKGIDLYEN